MILSRLLTCSVIVLAFVPLPMHADGKKNDATPVVPVSKPVQRTVTDFLDVTGRASAREIVTIQPRVTGYLVKIGFKEGTEVKAGEVLYEVDARPYEAQVAAARAKIHQGEATLRYAKSVNARFRELAKKQAGAVSARELDQYQTQEEQALAGIELDKANLQTALLNLDWTIIRAPIAGHIGRSNLTVGNLVKQDDTKLATLVSMDPMLVYFDLDERSLLRLQRARKGKPPGKAGADQPVLLGLASEEGFPRRGIVDFVDNRVNPKTGTLQMRAVVANPPAKGPAPLLPGMFVRVRLPIGEPVEALLVIDRAIVTDQGVKYVWVVDDESKVERRRVTLGPLQDDGLRVVEQGLKKDDTIVLGEFERLQHRMTIQPKRVPMQK